MHGQQFGSAKFGKAEDLIVPMTTAWQCQIWHFHGFGRATAGSLAVPNSAVQWLWQCHGWQFGGAKFWQCHGFGSATDGRLAVRNLAVPRTLQCLGQQFGKAKFGSATDGSLAVPNLALPRILFGSSTDPNSRCHCQDRHIKCNLFLIIN